MVCSVSAERESKMEIEKSIRFSNIERSQWWP